MTLKCSWCRAAFVTEGRVDDPLTYGLLQASFRMVILHQKLKESPIPIDTSSQIEYTPSKNLLFTLKAPRGHR
jgi:hypothetical protein